MISAWQVYLVMQLDAISTVACVFGTLLSIPACFFGGVGLIEDDDRQIKVAKSFLSISIPLLIIGTVLPNSRTAAAMIVVPALTGKEVVEPVAGEAKELYDLAKEALKNLAKKEEKK